MLLLNPTGPGIAIQEVQRAQSAGSGNHGLTQLAIKVFSAYCQTANANRLIARLFQPLDTVQLIEYEDVAKIAGNFLLIAPPVPPLLYAQVSPERTTVPIAPTLPSLFNTLKRKPEFMDLRSNDLDTWQHLF
jgi:hypothetical protein